MYTKQKEVSHDLASPPQETPGKYFFSGKSYITKGVSESLSLEEITAICLDLKAFVKEQDGIDYLQVYECTDGRKVWFIDQLDADMIASGDFAPEDNHCTMLLPEEY
ncbi:MAG: hypothetical protein Q7T20_12785 [Saprospiraceae bacterium]|nr:hypothetical protein [Saprospiraceae bacterium]